MHEIKINAPQDAGCKHRSRQRPIVEVDQTRDSAGLSLGALADVDTLARSLTKTGWPARRGETVFNRDETRLKPTFAGFAFSQIAGSIMLGIIINLFYRQSCRAALSAIRMQSRIWA